MSKSNYTVVTFDAQYIPEFFELNREWIETHFRLEPMDLAQLSDPYSAILDVGGEIFFVLDETSRAVGTCAMVPNGPGCFELAKMAVSPKIRGRGLGDLLMEAAIAWARAQGAESVMLLSNTVLTAAIALYKKYGFNVVHLGTHPDYERSNIEMKLELLSGLSKS